MGVTRDIHRDPCGDREAGWTRRVGLPAYEVARAAVLLGIDAKRLGHWYLPSRGARGTIPPVLTPRPPRKGLSYLDLIEAVVVRTLRDSGMSIGRIRKAYAYLRRKTGLDHPFARMKLERQGSSIYYEVYRIPPSDQRAVTVEATQDGQVVIRECIADGLSPLWRLEVADRGIQQLTFDPQFGITVRWYPRGRDFPVVVDPRFSFGVPVLEASRIPTSILLERHRAGASDREVAEDFGISEDEVQWALLFEGAGQRPEAV